MGLTQGIQWIEVLFLDWFELDCLRLENVNIVTQQTHSSHMCVYLSAVYSISNIHIYKNEEQQALGYIIIVLIALKVRWYDFSLYMNFNTRD